MQKRTIGHSSLEVFPIGLGAMGMSEFYGKAEDASSVRTLHEALELGVNFIDTADMYGIGHNERLLQSAFHDRWDQVVLATKFGIVRDENNNQVRGLSGKPAYVKQACEASLKRLGRDSIDLYYLHRVDPTTPIEETVGAMAELVQEGKVRYLGLSEVSGDTLRRASLVHPIAAVQSEYSLWSTDIETTTLPACRELGVSLVAYSPLGRGFLTGQIKKFEDLEADDYRRSSPRFIGENFQKNLDLVNRVGEIAGDKKCTPAQLALAWLLNLGTDIIPIPGTTKIANLRSNLEALHIALTPDEMESLAAIMGEVVGTRYTENGMKLTNA